MFSLLDEIDHQNVDRVFNFIFIRPLKMFIIYDDILTSVYHNFLIVSFVPID